MKYAEVINASIAANSAGIDYSSYMYVVFKILHYMDHVQGSHVIAHFKAPNHTVSSECIRIALVVCVCVCVCTCFSKIAMLS